MPRTSPRRLSYVNGLSALRRGDGPRRFIRPAGALLLAAAWCALAAPFAARAQNVQYTSKSADLGLRSDLKVNPSTHGLELRIPLADYPGRGGTGLPVALNYSSKVWRMKYATFQSGVTFVTAVYGEHSQGGWTFSLGFPVIDTESRTESYDAGGGATGGQCLIGGEAGNSCCYIDRVMVRMPDGSTHELRSTDTPVCYTGAGTTSITPPDDMYAVDGSRLRYRKSTKELFLPDGARYVTGGAGGSGQYIDRNGNVLTYDGTQWTDTLGRTLGGMLPTGSGTDPVLSLPGVGTSTLDYTLRWRHLSDAGVLSPGEQLSWTTNSTCPNHPSGNHPYTLFGSSSGGCIVSDYLHDPLVLYQVVLPTGQAYTFNYDRYGEVSKVTYPTGGYERYVHGQVDGASWVGDPYAAANRGVVDRYVSAGGSGTDEARWQYPTGVGGAFVFNEFRQGEITPDGTLTERLMHRDGGGAGFGYSYGGAMGGMAYEERVWSPPDASGSRQLLRRMLTKWEATGPGTTYQYAQQAARNGRVTKEVEILLDTNGGPALAKVTTYEYNLAYEFTTGANLKAVNEYDYVTVTQSAAQTAGVDSFAPPAQWLRRTEYDYLDDVNQSYRGRNLLGLKTETRVRDSSGEVVARTAVAYDQYGLADCPQIVNHDPAYGAAFTTRGNATGATSYADAAGMTGAVTATTNYDEAGNAVATTDANGNTSYVSYADNFSDSNNLRHTYAYPTGVTTPAPNPSAVPDPAGGTFPAGTFGSTTGFTSSTVYDFRTGRVTSQTDANNQTTSYDYADPLDRLKLVTRPDGGTTAYHYDRNQYGDYVRAMTALDSSRSVTSYQFFDGLGRPSRSFLSEGGSPAVYLTADTQYDSSGRVRRVSNPYRSTGADQPVNPAGLWTTTEYDALGRVKALTTPDGATVYTLYDGARTLVTDQAKKQRMSKADALGRLTDVWEVRTPDAATGTESVSFPISQNLAAAVPPVSAGYRTVYTYDALGNLRKVDQGGQQRFFMYDSLGRLTRARNPEQALNASLAAADPVTNNGQWATAYGYDAGGNLTSRTDARGVRTDYSYDRLGRNIITHYSGGGTATPDARRYYDNPTPGVNGLGRPYWTEKVGVSANVFDRYDAAGRPTQYHQVYWTGAPNWGVPFNVSLVYDKAGNITSQTYPSGHGVTYNYDAAGRVGDDGTQLAFTGNLGDGVARTYASQVTYGEFGGIREERFGTQTPLYHKLHYNRRGQLFDIRLSTRSLQAGEWDWDRGAILNYYGGNYAWEGNPSTPAGTDNNGNLRRSEVYAPVDAAGSYSGVAAPAAYYTAQQTYAYDALNRLGSVTETHYDSQAGTQAAPLTQAYGYDRWGNRTIDAAQTAGAPEPQFELAPQTNQEVAEPSNRLYAPGDAGRAPAQKLMRYDAAGNLTHDAHTGAGGRVYDAENRMTAAADSTGTWASYAYDADGRRVKRMVGTGAEVWQVYGAGGELLAEYAPGAAPAQPQKEYGYRSGELLVTAEPGSSSGGGTSAGLLGYWRFDEGAGVTAGDGSGGGHPGMLQAGAGWAVGSSGSSVGLDGADDYVQVGAGGLSVSSGLTVTAWVYPTGAGSDATAGGVVVCKEGEYELARFPDGTIRWAIANTSPGWDWVNTGFVAPLNQWTHLAVTYDGSAVKTYAGGQLVHTLAASGVIGDFNPSQNEFRVGGRQAMSQHFAGRLDEVRVYDRALAAGEVSVLSGAGPQQVGGAPSVHWLVADQLGTPRMVADRAGSLAGVARHDYLPFGEELSASTGGRATTQGYSKVDNVRQQFTGYERDDETGLDFAQARYYSSAHGRFTSTDPLIASGRPIAPQTWNRYGYALNNPLRLVDPTGLIDQEADKKEGPGLFERLAQIMSEVFRAYIPAVDVDASGLTTGDSAVESTRASDIPDPVMGFSGREVAVGGFSALQTGSNLSSTTLRFLDPTMSTSLFDTGQCIQQGDSTGAVFNSVGVLGATKMFIGSPQRLVKAAALAEGAHFYTPSREAFKAGEEAIRTENIAKLREAARQGYNFTDRGTNIARESSKYYPYEVRELRALGYGSTKARNIGRDPVTRELIWEWQWVRK